MFVILNNLFTENGTTKTSAKEEKNIEEKARDGK